MQIIPAIDLKEQQSVRLYQGDFNRTTIINASPLAQALAIEKAGLTRLHLVDLDGAKSGRPINRDVIEQICRQTNLQVEVGGGIRSLSQINAYLTSGVNRVILGSAALNNPQLVQQAIHQFGADQIVVGIDGKDGLVAVSGWLEQSSVSMAELMASMVAFGVKTFIVTDISRDGTLNGPNIDLLKGLQQKYSQSTVIASGGIRSITDLDCLARADIKAAIIGKAMATGDLPLARLAEVAEDVG
ncbi:MAG: 1-(5-phosphoribosyl)-5-[(5-phosphoribosylamino)methylideneamino]imidazole-4-carboxamide isomerase [Lentilactobacillus diolivorans]|jgi:phosphoribosylformimino-5-aminoimidazole carboxamide ribotide isomerase|uniref:1-(5-phosphoribosyl)-5-[(5-phosphoribosylamino)methylideneamino] imidazole-4-carboxamide isomerase n=2 Tax=Lentilactobacillus diolivorans TaxID=179838 RepID=A0A0R1SGC4_9LACO|nr:1-(5-phosphoribosyl)-5-[(5-phosphoribosylamino)methylideneamino]imidazole-4-carboxamide isomerase [Lentilactobacillus diolivorans]KRL65706.1 1-(5-phosphoribosyl)-5-[(5-phosphoribosylamino)methylideneamino] imidazole-4-carboxamide isomerase [Lentilactobacillus diolivorans DSM 14421]MCH4165892.1 1-(5-phosphoribosyl)-5-[(5-phosphoribosylamino)methylideneamino]imidazole-4-carboxamide isomerase [Lentilactobacillus diolivorans]RRG01179.1 MAG: 1-(5-phosphoribosyl)-5-[(5-phosphoribosylamino)methylide